MNVTIKILLILLLAADAMACGQSRSEDRDLARETQARGYWLDPSTGLMWAGKDNGKEVSWNAATKYCRNLRLAGYSDWRLAELEELQQIYDQHANSPGLNPKSHWHDAEPMDFHVKGGLFLTGLQWSGSRRLDDRLKPSGYAWRFDFLDGHMFGGDETWFGHSALCVRAPAVASNRGSNGAGAADDRSSAEWVDPATGLMWSTRDDGTDVNMGEALKYCRDLRSSGYADWRLAMIEELEGVHWPDGKVLLTGDPWSGSPVNDDGYPSEFFWYFSVKTRTRVFDNSSFSRAKRALCVRGLAPVTKRLGYWVDPSTGRMWAGTDNLGNSILYFEATKYCRDLRLARYSDWRLATIEEMQGIYDKSVEAAGESRRTDEHGPEPVFFHVKGNIFLTGMEWANTRANEGTGPHDEVFVFDFNDGRPVHEKAYSIREKRALCVR